MLASSEATMPAVQFKRMNWFQKVPLWKYNEAWRKHHAQETGKFLDTTSAAMSSFTNAVVGQINGSGSITTQVAVQRIQAETQARLSKLI
jgi:hypothetical protein